MSAAGAHVHNSGEVLPDVSSIAPAEVRTWIVFDVHKNSLVAGVLPAAGGAPEVTRLENTERAVRRFIDRLGDRDGLAVADQARRASRRGLSLSLIHI